MNSNATSTRLRAMSSESVPSSHGRTAQPGTERVAARAAERVPVAHGEPQVVPHRLAFDHLVRVVVPERERVLAVRAFVLDRWKRRGRTTSVHREGRSNGPQMTRIPVQIIADTETQS